MSTFKEKEIYLEIPEKYFKEILYKLREFSKPIGDVYIAGAWNNWGDSPEKPGHIRLQEVNKMIKDGENFSIGLNLLPGIYEFKPVVVVAIPGKDGMVSGQWISSPEGGNWILTVIE